jgi:hypothetical protein
MQIYEVFFSVVVENKLVPHKAQVFTRSEVHARRKIREIADKRKVTIIVHSTNEVRPNVNPENWTQI